MKLFGSLKELVSVVFRKDGKEVTLQVGTQAGTATSRVFTLPDIDSNSDVAHELLTENAVQNVTNKTIDADSNTITNIENADIKVGAAIDAAKIGSGTVSNTEFGYLDGVSSAIQTQINGKQATITGAATTITSSDLTASKALQSDASGKVSASSVTNTELGYVSGVTSAIQTQINSKQATITGAATTIVSSDLSVSKALQSDASGKVSASSVTSTELGYVSGVTSAIQTQLGNKAAKGANSDITSLSGLTTALSIGQGGTGQTTANTALNALLPSQASAANKYLKSDGTNTSWASASGGAGELNAILNASGADGTTGWTNVSVVSGASSPLNPVVTTAFSISNAATTESSTSGGYYPFTMPSGMLNRKLKVEFTYTTPATDVYKVSIYKGSTRVALSTDVSGSTSLPASVTGGKFVAYFDTDSSTSWTLSVTRTSGSTGACVVTNVIVGPGIQPQGAVVGEWTSYTPTITNITIGNGTITGQYRRVGTSIHTRVAVTFGSTSSISGAPAVSLPSGLTVDSSKISTNPVSIIGNSFIRKSGGSSFIGNVIYDSTGAAVYGADDAVNGVTYQSIQNLFTWAAGDYFTSEFSLPISEWAGSGTVQLAQNDVEYAWNGSTSTTSDPTNFGYGPQGVLIRDFAPSGTNAVSKRVRFQTPIQSSDVLTLEIQDGSGLWVPYANRSFGFASNEAATTLIGANMNVINSTDVDVNFYSRYSWLSAWSAVNTFKWRVRKSSAGAAVGFGIVSPGVSSGLVSASGLPGNTTGNAIAAGYVGEIFGTLRSGTGGFTYSTRSTTAVPPTTSSSVISLVLNKGIYLISYRIRCASSTVSNIDANLYIGGTQVEYTAAHGYATASQYGSAQSTLPIVISSDSTTVAVYARLDTGTSYMPQHELFAVRIA